MKGILTNTKNGYEILSKGYGLVKNISEGNFKLYDAFPYGLLTVNPNLRKYRKVAGILEYQVSIQQRIQGRLQSLQERRHFRPEELDQLYRANEGPLDRNLQNIGELTMVFAASKPGNISSGPNPSTSSICSGHLR